LKKDPHAQTSLNRMLHRAKVLPTFQEAFLWPSQLALTWPTGPGFPRCNKPRIAK